MSFPKVVLVKQTSDVPAIADVAAAVKREIAELDLTVKSGAQIAIAVGSRGITDIAVIVKTIVDELKNLGAKPFIVPAMGSHGGATAEGQIMVLETLGVTENFVGAPIRSSMEVVQLGTTESGIPVFVDKNAVESDGIVVVNRVKAHTDWDGPTESGMLKLMTIGLGKQKGAQTAHKFAVKYGFKNVIPVVGRYVLEHAPVLFGVGLVENFYHQQAIIKAIKPELLEETEKALLVESKKLMARIPFDTLDVLVIQEIGKKISGTGMDTNVIGRIYLSSEPEPDLPQYTEIVALDLADGSYGNATGIGLADFTTRRLVNKMDVKATNINCVAGACPARARVPITEKTDGEAIANALLICGP